MGAGYGGAWTNKFIANGVMNPPPGYNHKAEDQGGTTHIMTTQKLTLDVLAKEQ